MKQIKFLLILLLSLAVGGLITKATGVPLAFTFGVVFITSVIPKERSAAFDGITVEFWVDYIMGALFKDNQFLERCHKDDQFVIGGSIVHIPQAGAKPTVVKNRNTFPAVTKQRVDNDIVYPLDIYTTDPTHIPKAELMEISFDKIDSVLGEHMATLREALADDILAKWAARLAVNQILTTGANLDGHVGSGQRKKFVKENLKAAKKRMNILNISKTDRIALIDSEMMDQLEDDDDLKKRDFGQELDMKGGTIARLYGFDIIERSSVNIFDNSATPQPKDSEAEEESDDKAGVLCYQKDAVARALGTVDFFEDLKNPTYYGDIYSALVKMGGRQRRTDGAGVVSIIQDAAA